MSKTSQNQQAFLRSFFDRPGYAECYVNDFWLVKMVNGQTGAEIVAVNTEEAFKNYKKYQRE